MRRCPRTSSAGSKPSGRWPASAAGITNASMARVIPGPGGRGDLPRDPHRLGVSMCSTPHGQPTYRAAMPIPKALGIMRDEVGPSFDPACFAALERALARLENAEGASSLTANARDTSERTLRSRVSIAPARGSGGRTALTVRDTSRPRPARVRTRGSGRGRRGGRTSRRAGTGVKPKRRLIGRSSPTSTTSRGRRSGGVEGRVHEAAADAASLEARIDGQGSQHEERPTGLGWPQADGADEIEPTRAVKQSSETGALPSRRR